MKMRKTADSPATAMMKTPIAMTVKDMTASRKTPMNPIMNRKTAISQEIIQTDILMSIPTAIPAGMDTNRMNPAHRPKTMIMPIIITAMTRAFMRMNI